jgi:hypothetical protein
MCLPQWGKLGEPPLTRENPENPTSASPEANEHGHTRRHAHSSHGRCGGGPAAAGGGPSSEVGGSGGTNRECGRNSAAMCVTACGDQTARTGRGRPVAGRPHLLA